MEGIIKTLTSDQQAQMRQLLRDAWEIRSALGYMWMRMAVAADAQDAFDVGKREFTDHEAAFARLEHSIPAALAIYYSNCELVSEEDGPWKASSRR